MKGLLLAGHGRLAKLSKGAPSSAGITDEFGLLVTGCAELITKLSRGRGGAQARMPAEGERL